MSYLICGQSLELQHNFDYGATAAQSLNHRSQVINDARYSQYDRQGRVQNITLSNLSEPEAITIDRDVQIMIDKNSIGMVSLYPNSQSQKRSEMPFKIDRYSPISHVFFENYATQLTLVEAIM